MPIRQKSVGVTLQNQARILTKSSWTPYVCPFVVFIVLTSPANYFPDSAHLLYLAKTLLVGGLLWFWRHHYLSDLAPRLSPAGYLAAAAAGLAVLPVWILPEALLPQLGASAGFNPYAFGCPPAAVPALIAVRLVGAALVVPVMEELFWRSFLLRYFINPNFQKVALGTFTWFSFAAVVILFGLEHHRWLQGMMAGAVYTALVVWQKSLRGCIIAHALTNLGLSVYVIATEQWMFW
ncbi:MAG: CAAX prenyl protease-related protein [Desulfosalsimonadaceae bacterium]